MSTPFTPFTAYKAMHGNVCRNQTYEEGQTYTLPGKPRLCEHGIHACRDIRDIPEYYDLDGRTRIYAVTVFGPTDERLTQVLKDALALVDVRVNDHMVVAGTQIVSLAERGLI